MANTKSAAKSARQNDRRSERNASVLASLKTGQKKLTKALASGKPDEAKAEFSKFSSALDKAAKRGVIHGNVADRKKSRISKTLAKIKP
jgi:small subunit ribosomal protein S20